MYRHKDLFCLFTIVATVLMWRHTRHMKTAADRAVKCQALIYDRDHFNWNILALYAYRIS